MLHDRFDPHGNDLAKRHRNAVLDNLTRTPAYVPTHPVIRTPEPTPAPAEVSDRLVCRNSIAHVSGRYTPLPKGPTVLPEPEPTPDFDAMTREALRAEAKRLGIAGMGRMLKPDLLAAVKSRFTAAA